MFRERGEKWQYQLPALTARECLYFYLHTGDKNIDATMGYIDLFRIVYLKIAYTYKYL